MNNTRNLPKILVSVAVMFGGILNRLALTNVSSPVKISPGPGKRLIGGSLFVFVLAGTALAQETRALIENPREPVPATAAPPLVTAIATAKRVRFVSPGTVVQLRLEVYNETGQKLFDTELHGGNVLDWHLQDGGGERLPAGSYATVLTIKSLSGRLSQRVGLVTIDEKKAAIEAAGAAQLSIAQQQTIGPVEGNAAFTILQPSEAEAITAVAHDGTDGQVTSTTGALTFRTGNVFAGKDKEHMRITEAGNVGIGTDKPAATLDVAGTIRAQNGIRFDDGTMLKSASNSPGSRTDANGDPLPALNTANTGTQGRLAKWTETGGAGGLGDSAVFESGGLIGIGTTSPEGTLHIESPNTTVSKLVTSGSAATGRAVFQMYRGTSAAANGWDFGYNTDLSSERFIIRELTNGGAATRLAISKVTGNVGIGTTNPAAKLDVEGNINTSTEYRIGGDRVFRIPASTNTFVGRNAGLAHTFSNYNSFFGDGAGAANVTALGNGNSFFGASAGSNSTRGANNSFFGAFAGSSNTTENYNTFVGSRSNGEAGITNATAIGYRALVTQSDSLVLGSVGNINGLAVGTNVGIGTTAPSAVLEVIGSQPLANAWAGGFDATPVLKVIGGQGGNGTSHGGTGGVVLIEAGNGGNGDHGGDGGSIMLRPGSPSIGTVSGLAAAPGHVLLAPTVGNVGIGVLGPAYKLHVINESFNGLRVQTNTPGGEVASFGGFGKFQIDAEGVPAGRFIVNNVGDVGIGVPNPLRKLHISNAMRLQPIASPPASPASGDLYFDSSEALCVYVSGAWAKLAGTGTCQ